MKLYIFSYLDHNTYTVLWR